MESNKPTVVEDELLDLQPAGPLSGEEEKSLADFLKRVAVACDGDKSVPDFVGAQVSQWLKEMEEQGDNDGEIQADLGGS